jgi:hypothetical protein
VTNLDLREYKRQATVPFRRVAHLGSWNFCKSNAVVMLQPHHAEQNVLCRRTGQIMKVVRLFSLLVGCLGYAPCLFRAP